MVVVSVNRVAIAHHIDGTTYLVNAPIMESPGTLQGTFAVSNRVRLIVVPEFNREICYVLDIDREEWAKLKEAL